MDNTVKNREGENTAMEAFAAIAARHLGEMLKECCVVEDCITKENGDLAPIVRIYRKEGGEAVPICLERAYWQFRDRMPIDGICRNVAASYRRRKPEHVDSERLHDFDAAKDHVCLRLINGERNKERLKLVPHRIMHDLAVVYYVEVERKDHIENVAVDHGLAASWQVAEDEIFKHALENTVNLYGCFINRVPDQISESGGLKAPVDREELPFDNSPSIFYAAGPGRNNGAAILLNEDICRWFAKEVSGSFYIVPVGNGAALVPESSGAGEKELLDIVRERNKNLREKDFLTDSIYLYPADGSGIIRTGQCIQK